MILERNGKGFDRVRSRDYEFSKVETQDKGWELDNQMRRERPSSQGNQERGSIWNRVMLRQRQNILEYLDYSTIVGEEEFDPNPNQNALYPSSNPTREMDSNPSIQEGQERTSAFVERMSGFTPIEAFANQIVYGTETREQRQEQPIMTEIRIEREEAEEQRENGDLGSIEQSETEDAIEETMRRADILKQKQQQQQGNGPEREMEEENRIQEEVLEMRDGTEGEIEENGEQEDSELNRAIESQVVQESREMNSNLILSVIPRVDPQDSIPISVPVPVPVPVPIPSSETEVEGNPIPSQSRQDEEEQMDLIDAYVSDILTMRVRMGENQRERDGQRSQRIPMRSSPERNRNARYDVRYDGIIFEDNTVGLYSDLADWDVARESERERRYVNVPETIVDPLKRYGIYPFDIGNIRKIGIDRQRVRYTRPTGEGVVQENRMMVSIRPFEYIDMKGIGLIEEGSKLGNRRENGTWKYVLPNNTELYLNGIREKTRKGIVSSILDSIGLNSFGDETLDKYVKTYVRDPLEEFIGFFYGGLTPELVLTMERNVELKNRQGEGVMTFVSECQVYEILCPVLEYEAIFGWQEEIIKKIKGLQYSPQNIAVKSGREYEAEIRETIRRYYRGEGKPKRSPMLMYLKTRGFIPEPHSISRDSIYINEIEGEAMEESRLKESGWYSPGIVIRVRNSEQIGGTVVSEGMLLGKKNRGWDGVRRILEEIEFVENRVELVYDAFREIDEENSGMKMYGVDGKAIGMDTIKRWTVLRTFIEVWYSILEEISRRNGRREENGGEEQDMRFLEQFREALYRKIEEFRTTIEEILTKETEREQENPRTKLDAYSILITEYKRNVLEGIKTGQSLERETEMEGSETRQMMMQSGQREEEDQETIEWTGSDGKTYGYTIERKVRNYVLSETMERFLRRGVKNEVVGVSIEGSRAWTERIVKSLEEGIVSTFVFTTNGIAVEKNQILIYMGRMYHRKRMGEGYIYALQGLNPNNPDLYIIGYNSLVVVHIIYEESYIHENGNEGRRGRNTKEEWVKVLKESKMNGFRVKWMKESTIFKIGESSRQSLSTVMLYIGLDKIYQTEMIYMNGILGSNLLYVQGNHELVTRVQIMDDRAMQIGFQNGIIGRGKREENYIYIRNPHGIVAVGQLVWIHIGGVGNTNGEGWEEEIGYICPKSWGNMYQNSPRGILVGRLNETIVEVRGEKREAGEEYLGGNIETGLY